jgi:hypothetical protein
MECIGCGSILTKSLLYYPSSGKLHKGFCKNCSCETWFEPNGEYKDPPLTDIVHETVDATVTVRDSNFCVECSRNQTIVMQIMANYLPEETDPEYDVLFQNYNKYKTELESRYPLVCRNCKPFVNRKLWQVNKRLWSIYKENTDPTTVKVSKSNGGRLLILGIVIGICLLDWIQMSQRISNLIIVSLDF